jgi:hypothetical protein
MRIFRASTEYPKDRDLTGVIRAAVLRVSEKLAHLNSENIAISDSSKEILCDMPGNIEEIPDFSMPRLFPRLPRARWALRTAIERAGQTFAWALPDDETPFSDLTLIAFNDGFGILSLIARECNIGTIVYVNPDDRLCDDARAIGRATGNRADHYIYGDIEDVHFYIKRTGIECDVFVSRDGIGNSTDPELFFDTLFDISDRGFSFGFDSAEPLCTSIKQSLRIDEASSLRRHLITAGFRVEQFHTSAASRGPVVPRLKGSLSDLASRLIRRRPSGQPPDTFDRYAIFGTRPPGTLAELVTTHRHNPIRTKPLAPQLA